MQTKNPIIVALDVPDLQEAQRLITDLESEVGGFKVGLELFIAEGRLPDTKLPIILDLKLHDIPNTVVRAIHSAGRSFPQVQGMTLHIQQRETLEAAVEAADKYDIQLFGVTVLTSMTTADLGDLGMRGAPEMRAVDLARFGWKCGVDGFVCSPKEVAAIREAVPGARLLVPGVRPSESSLHDQKRVSTPKEAVDAGANFIVVGRPITEATSPKAAAADIAASLLRTGSYL